MKNRYQILAEVFGSVRRAGHTMAAARGARESGGVVLCFSHREAQDVLRTTNAEALGVDSAEILRGRRIPILLDNHLVQVMAEEVVILQDRVERDACALEKMDRRLTEEVRVGEALRRLVRTNEWLEDSAQLNGALFALAAIGTAVAFGRAMELLDFAQFPSNVTLPFARKIDALLRAVGLEDVIP